MQWGDRWLDGGRVELRHRDCGEPVGVELRWGSGHEVDIGDLELALRTGAAGRGERHSPVTRRPGQWLASPGLPFVMRAVADPAPLPRGRVPAVESTRSPLRDGSATTLHVAAFPVDGVSVRVARLPEPETLLHWCRRTGVAHAIVGGFFERPHNAPLGELRIDDAPVGSVPFTAPWDARRSCLHVAADGVTVARRDELPAEPAGDLLQAGPLLVRDGASAVTDGDDEGFAEGAHQFDSDISDGRHPRCALALTPEHLLAVAADGRHAEESGLTLGELADALVGLGARSAVNLDGGGSASLVCDGRLVNRPREQHGIELLDGRPIATAIVLAGAA